ADRTRRPRQRAEDRAGAAIDRQALRRRVDDIAGDQAAVDDRPERARVAVVDGDRAGDGTAVGQRADRAARGVVARAAVIDAISAAADRAIVGQRADHARVVDAISVAADDAV